MTSRYILVFELFPDRLSLNHKITLQTCYPHGLALQPAMPLRSDAYHVLNGGLSHGHGAGLQLPRAILPPEIRLMVLEELERLVEGRSRLSNFSTVLAERRAFFQPQIFETLSIRHPGPDVTELDANVRGDRTKLVKRISLHVTTEEYNARKDFDRPDSGVFQRVNDKMLQEALHDLFRVLSKWGDAKDAHGISLDISLSSRSDAEHQLNHRNDRPHLSRSRIYSQDSERCLLGSLFGPGLARPPLPRVPIIERLSMSNQNYAASRRSLCPETFPACAASKRSTTRPDALSMWRGTSPGAKRTRRCSNASKAPPRSSRYSCGSLGWECM
ncbi:hypothetical protein CDEST_01768 [Colletotrichum destructivum]|uniref:Uncharacterized protein n=1 Tax=Colletotrichum destructivum TaxID=34406 RepID=A0AAX4I0M1_9PEZI|nr:hypothetical protein CDEST_01768 [Colletotrichum destructivum]